MDQRQHWNPAAHQYFPGSHPPVGPPPPPAPRRTGLVVGLVVSAAIAIGATTTAIVVGTSHGTNSTPSPALAGLPSGGLPSALPSNTGGGAPTVRSASPPVGRTDPPAADPSVATGGDDRENSGGVPDDGSDSNGGDLDGGDQGSGDTGGDTGGSGGGDRPQGSAQSQRNDILQSALAWIDARNSGDGERTLQLGCSDDVSAVQSGQPNPAAYAGYTAFRPTGEVIGHSSGLAAYVVISSQNLQTGGTQPSRLPIVWEQGGWRMCYYPGAETNRITGG
ncbi:MAG: hypothetical protein INR72_18965 [Williamsia herbipolensis]|nr:hypothetical protein [Williamsia herbipolensis]